MLALADHHTSLQRRGLLPCASPSPSAGIAPPHHSQSLRQLLQAPGWRPAALGSPGRCRRRVLAVKAEKSLGGKWHKNVYDAEKEKNRRARRTVFGFEDWKRHRSSYRYIYHLKTLFESGVVRGIFIPVTLVVFMTLLIATYTSAQAAGWLPAWAPPTPTIAIEPMQLTSFALSLLLVFRTNASYSRWQEARKAFGSLTTVGRDLARQALAWFAPTDHTGKARIARWLVALPKSAMCHLREDHEVSNELREVLRADELAAVEKAAHRPSFCIQMVTKVISIAGMPQELVIRMDENVSKLTEAVAACERILNTPVPLSYTRHTARFLMFWLICLPFALWSYCGWMMVPIASLVAFVLLGIEEIGVYIEEPFSILSMEQLCNRQQAVIYEMLRDHRALDALASNALAEGAGGSVPAWQQEYAEDGSVSGVSGGGVALSSICSAGGSAAAAAAAAAVNSIAAGMVAGSNGTSGGATMGMATA